MKHEQRDERESKKEARNSMDSKIVSRIWGFLALRGVLAILFGIVALFYTGQTMLALVYVFGVFAIAGGIMSIVAAVRAGEAHQRWGWLVASGLLSVAAGLVAFAWPGITALAVVILVAAWAIVTGMAEIAFAFAAPETLLHPVLAGLSGLLSVVFGVLLLVWPRDGAVTLTWLIGIYAIVYGITGLYYAFLLRGVQHGAQRVEQFGRRMAGEVAQN
jgi:uncharacterized membrane protein HdeD (DUF308 family)